MSTIKTTISQFPVYLFICSAVLSTPKQIFKQKFHVHVECTWIQCTIKWAKVQGTWKRMPSEMYVDQGLQNSLNVVLDMLSGCCSQRYETTRLILWYRENSWDTASLYTPTPCQSWLGLRLCEDHVWLVENGSRLQSSWKPDLFRS